MATPVKSDNRNLLALMRILRPLLPGEVTKLSTTEYVVEDKVKVHLNYYCHWNKAELETATKTCYPQSITVSAYIEGAIRKQLNRGVSSKGSIFSTRTYQANDKGEFNLKAIGVAVTKCIEGTDKFIAQVKEQDAKQEAAEKLQKQTLEDLGKLLKPLKLLRSGYGGGYYHSKDHEVEFGIIRVKDVNDPIRYTIEFKGLTKEQVKMVIPIASALINSPVIEEDND